MQRTHPRFIIVLTVIVSLWLAACHDSGSGASPMVITPTPEMGVLGVAFGEHYKGQGFKEHMTSLGAASINMAVWWSEVEPAVGTYDFTTIDRFVQELGPDVTGLLRITARHNTWGTTAESGYTVPTDLGAEGAFSDYVSAVVARTAGKVQFFESEWEADNPEHWGGTAEQYAEMTRTFYQAVKRANPDAVVVLGGTIGNGGLESLAFFSQVFASLAADQMTSSFDLFDVHLYDELYDIPGRMQGYRNLMDSYPEFENKPIVVTEYGGPSPREFSEKYPEEWRDLQNLQSALTLTTDLCLFSTDMPGYPDEFRMFAYGLTGPDLALEEKRDRIQGREMVQRTLLALAEGAVALQWWNLTSERHPLSSELGCDYFRHPTFGKMQLMRLDPDNGGMSSTLYPNPVFPYFQTMTDSLGNTRSVSRVTDAGNPGIYLFKAMRADGQPVYIVWEQRDVYEGENLPAIPYTFSVPWTSVCAVDVFGNSQGLTVTGSTITVSITDTPVFVEDGINGCL